MTRQASENHIHLNETELFYRHWAPTEVSPGQAPRAVFIFHRGHEHSGRAQELVAGLEATDAHVIAWDGRGHGLSAGRRGFAPDGFASLVDDMDAFVRTVAEDLGVAMDEVIIIAHSVAAVVAATWIHDRNPGIRAAVLATPAFSVRLYVPFALPLLRVLNRIKPHAKISSYVKGKLLTHDHEMANDYDADKLISKDISNRVLIEMADAAKRVVADAHTIATPILMIQASADWVVDNSVQDRFFARLSSSCKQRVDVPGAYHAVFHERSRQQTFHAVARFLRERWALPTPAVDADAITAVNRQTHEQLNQPLSLLNPKRWAFSMTRHSMRTVGKLSAGIRTGWRHGFDSGSMLDHVYRNQAKGCFGIGRVFDRQFLNSIGWRGIRLRKDNMQRALTWCANQPREANAEYDCRIVDIASGPGRYVLDFMRSSSHRLSAICRDRDEQGLTEGRAIASERQLENITYEPGDAFDPTSIATLNGRIDVAIASGVYELFADNEMISRSLGALHDALPDDGLLIYTNQPWHPQLEFIARALTNRDHQPWVMRCRPQAEIDAMVSAAGFRKIQTFSDPWGIFTVSIARRQPDDQPAQRAA